MLPHHLGKLIIQFFVYIQQICNKMKTQPILSAPILIPLCVYLCMLTALNVLTEYLKYLSNGRHSYFLR